MRGAQMLTSAQGTHYSVITRCELFAGRYVEEPDIRELLAGFVELPLCPEIAEAAGRLRRHSRITAPDALIAATVLGHGLPLLSRNARDFTGVPGLLLQSPE